jgi:hypothetical protein
LIQRPLALLVALILATPVAWNRRVCAVLAGVPVLHGCVLALLAYCLWAESSEVQLVDLSRNAKTLASSFEQAAIGQVGMGLPVIIWALLTLMHDDVCKFYAGMFRGPAPSGSVDSTRAKSLRVTLG